METKISPIFVLMFLFLLIPCSKAFVGVSPSYYDINFEPYLEGEYFFRFSNNQGSELTFEVLGDLSEYVKILEEKKGADNTYDVLIKLKLPENIETPGLNIIRISGKEKLSETLNGITLGLNVNALLRIRVPYPAKYAELELSTELINQGESLPYNLVVYSRGEEDIVIKPHLEIRTPEGELVKEMELEEKEIKSTENVAYEGLLSTKTYSPGDYNLIAIVDYDEGKYVNASTLIRLGEMKLRIINYTQTFEKNKLNPFSLEVESLWNNPIDHIYADVEVLGFPHKTFTTPSWNIDPWGTKTLSGYLDTIDIEEKNLQLKLNVHYGDKLTSQIVNVTQKNEFDWNTFLIVTGIIIVILIIILLILYIIKLKESSKNEKKKEKN